MLMAMEPIWENDFSFVVLWLQTRAQVHHAIRAVKLQMTESNEQWSLE